MKFPLLFELGLASAPNESLRLKVEISHHRQTAIISKTPVFCYGQSFVPAHFSLETMMAGKMIACLERNFQRGRDGAILKGRNYYDLLWFMQKKIDPLKEKLAGDGAQAYTVHSAMLALKGKIDKMKKESLGVDLLPMFESRLFIESWLDTFHDVFNEHINFYLES